MIIYKEKTRELVIPNGLGNLNGITDEAMSVIKDAAFAEGVEVARNEMETAVIDRNGVYERPEGWNRVEVNVEGGGSGGDCENIQDYRWVRPSMGETAENGDIYIYPDEGYDAVRYIDLDPGTIYQEGVEQGRAEAGNLEDKWITPEVGDIDDNGLIVTDPSEGFGGMRRVVTDPSRLRDTWYGEGYEQGKAEGGGESGGCTLTTRIITQNGTYRADDDDYMPMIDFSQNGAFDSQLYVDENTYIEFYFAFKEEQPDLMSFYGCEDSDWKDSTFAARYYSGDISVKIGSIERSFNVDEYGLRNGNAHKMKVGKNYGIAIDDRMLVTPQEFISEGIIFEPPKNRTIYIGAINSPDVDDNGLGIFWRPFYGYIGAVTIQGKTEGDENTVYNYVPGDFGWWGEYRIVETDQRLENIYREPGATPLTDKFYESNIDGFSEVTVDLALAEKEYSINEPYTRLRADVEGLAGFSAVNINAEGLINSAKNEGINYVNDSLGELYVTNNHTYTATGIYDVQEDILRFYSDTGVFVTDFTPILNDSAVDAGGFVIEVQAKVNYNEEGNKFILGCAISPNWEDEGIDTTMNNVVLKANIDATCLFMSGCKTSNIPTINGEWVTYRITEDGLYWKKELQQEWNHIGWEGDVRPRDVWNNKSNDCPIAIGGLNTFYDGIYPDFQGSIRYVYIKQGDYNKTWIPADNGELRVRNTDQRIVAQKGNAPEFTYDIFKEGDYGWKKINVRISVVDYDTKEFLDDWFVTNGYYDLNDTVNSKFQNVVVNGVNNGVLENIFQGHYVPYSGEVLVPHFIESFMTDDENAKTVKIGRLVKDITVTNNYVNGVYSINRFNCINVESVDIEAFKGMVGLKYLGGFVNLGYSFSEPQTIDFSIINIYANRWRATDSLKELAESLYDFTTPNKNGVSGSTIKFKADAESIEQNAEGFEILRRKGWTIEFA